MIEITAEEAIKELSRYDNEFYTPKNRAAHRMAVEALSKDAVEVVRCQECAKTWCYLRQELGPDGFCSAGERNDNETKAD